MWVCGNWPLAATLRARDIDRPGVPCMSFGLRTRALDQSDRYAPPVPIRTPEHSSRLGGQIRFLQVASSIRLYFRNTCSHVSNPSLATVPFWFRGGGGGLIHGTKLSVTGPSSLFIPREPRSTDVHDKALLKDVSKSDFIPLYGALVHSHLEYSMQASSPNLVADINHSSGPLCPTFCHFKS